MTDEQKTALYEEFHTKVLRYLSGKLRDSQLAEDLCSEVFLKVFEKLDIYDAEKASLSTWIFTITHNTLTDYFRSRRVFEEIPETLADDDTPEDSYCTNETLTLLAGALEKLEPRLRDIIIFRYYKGMTLTDIAQKMGISYAYIKVLHNKALAAMRPSFG